MPSFRRAHLGGSDELFRTTTGETTGEPAPGQAVVPAAEASAEQVRRVPVSRAAQPQGRLVRLTDEEIHLLSEALQRSKYPQKLGPKPPVDEYERLEELRQKLLSA